MSSGQKHPTSAYEFNTLRTALADGILEIVLSRPGTRNAMSHEMEREISAALDRAELDPDVAAVMVRGDGEIFSAGHDLKEQYGGRPFTEEGFPEASPSIPPTLPRAWYFRKPLISGVHGYVGPAAIGLVACSDFIIAATGTRFGCEMYRGRGARPAMEWLPLYVQLPMRVVEKLFLLGGWMDAEQALQFQFVQRVVPEDGLAKETRRWAEQAALIPSATFGHSKDQIRRAYELLGLAAIPASLSRLRPPDSAPRVDFGKVLEEQGLRQAVRARDAGFDEDVARV
ncbi:enoyl-CoA hydratase/isomerase family protein [Catenulispora rubra]|uniref:enoyl-CoA hydratase/isomerase family protein n=1 Tax=Catenulispora rubra TaxID=280293 RepID=UPI0018921BF7|nr:enoyl-CoA hydratase/isomerase family protein [Catenulispora rubra]